VEIFNFEEIKRKMSGFSYPEIFWPEFDLGR
jgi:hypothetical protein